MAHERDGKRPRSRSQERGGGGKEDHSKHRKYHHSSGSRDRNSRDRSRSRSRSPESRQRKSSRSWHSRSPSRDDSRNQNISGSRAEDSRNDSRKHNSSSYHNNNSSSGYNNRNSAASAPRSRRSPSLDKWEKHGSGVSNEQDELRIQSKEGEELQKQAMKALAAIQDGSKKAKRVIVKQRGKFDWENTEDTSQDMNPICSGQLLFGRGFFAGTDRREQKKKSAQLEREFRGQVDGKPQKSSVGAYDLDDMPVERHWSEKEVHEMTSRDWRIFREDFNISYKGSKFPQPIRNWEESGLSPELLKSVQEAGYKKPTPIQMASIPLGLQQRDVIGIAGTGSGKTAAFVLPMLMYITRLPRMTLERAAEGPYALVMAPTTELAQQIHDETVKMARHMEINVVSLVAGENIGGQSSKLLQGCEIVIATPGRLLHALEQGYAVLNQCNYVVLDEGDRMIDLGFEEQVADALNAMPSSNMKPENEDEPLEANRIYRTTYMFSATMPSAVERLAKQYLRNPVVVTIEEASKRISQRVMMVDEEEKPKRLRRLLDEIGEMSTIVFVNTKKQADKVSKQLADLGIKVATIHGGKTQQKRQTNFQDFRSKRRSCLIATDVVGRGIDIPDVGHIVNYDMSKSIEMYIHRIGRTGRAGKSGAATTFLTLHDSDVFYDLKQLLQRTKNPVPAELARHEAAKVKPVKPAAGTSWNAEAAN